MTKSEKIEKFDPDGPAVNPGLFGLPFNYQESETVVLPVPWEVTVSYHSGTYAAPRAILKASRQVDLFDPFLPEAWKKGVYFMDPDKDLEKKGKKLRKKSLKYLEALDDGVAEKYLKEDREKIDKGCAKMNEWVAEKCHKLLKDGKRVILLGGDHSTPLGFMQALGSHYESFGILQIDAHADLREAYEGFKYSHASIFHNAMKQKNIERLVQVGVRDYGAGEFDMIRNSHGRIISFFDRELKKEAYLGKSWKEQCDEMVENLPENVYLSFDIDGLDPKLCPHTGTPVMGGFEAEAVLFLIERVVESGRKLIGADLCEVVPGNDDWDANVAARLLYRISNYMAASYKY